MITMIRYLFELLDPPGRRHLRVMLALLVGQGVLQGLGFLCVAPIVTTLAAEPVDRDGALRWIGSLAALVVAHHAMLAWSTSLGYRIGTDVLTSFHSRIGNHLAVLPISWFNTARTGPVARLLSKGTVDIANLPAHLLRYVVVGVVTPATMVLGSYLLDWRIGVAFTVGALLCGLALWLLMSGVARNDDQYEHDIGDSSSRIVEFARQQPVLRAYGVLDRPELGTLGAALDRQRASQSRLTIGGAWNLMVFYGAVQLVLTAVIALTVAFAVDGSLTVASMVGLLVITLRLLDPVAQLGDLAGYVQVNADAIHRVRRLLAEPRLPEPERPATPSGYDIELRGVRFGYTSHSVLNGIDARLPQGTLTAIVGPSGAGKSTLLKLIGRYFDTDDGVISIGGHDVRKLGSAAVADITAQVFQEVYLFEGTIAENLRMADPSATDAELTRVARIARLDEVIDRLPDGWNTRVGEAGSTLSGGEKQRVSIARALLKDAPIVLFDEATAALDAANDAAIAAAIAELARDRTVVVVAHRMSTVAAADQILVLDEGRFTERGTHAELINLDGTYSRFWHERRRAKGWQL